MLPSQDDINEVAESILKGGTRYRTEKITVVAAYVAIVVSSLGWAFSGFEFGARLEGEFEAQKIENIENQNFVLKNPTSTTWHDVRIVLNDRYLAKIDEVAAGERMRLEPTDFRYYFHVPRPWGQREWERVGARSKPEAGAPRDVTIESLAVHTRQGEVNVDIQRDS